MAADASYYINLIIKARDETAQAVAKALGQTELLAAAQKRQADDLARSNKDLEASYGKLSKSQKQLRDETINSTGTIAREMQKVDKEVKRVSSSMGDQGTKIREARMEVDKYQQAAEAANKKYEELTGTQGKAAREAKANLRALMSDQDKLGLQLDRLRQKQGELNNMFSRDERANSIERQVVAVQKLADRYTDLQRNEKATTQERINMSKDLEASTRDLQILMSKGETLSEALNDSEARRSAQAIRNNQLQIAQQRQLQDLRRASEQIGTRLGRTDDGDARADLLRKAKEIDDALDRLAVNRADRDIIQAQRAAREIAELRRRGEDEATKAAEKAARDREAVEAEYERQIAALDKAQTSRRRKEQEEQLASWRAAQMSRIKDEEQAERDRIKNAENTARQRSKLENDYSRAVKEAAQARARLDTADRRGASETTKLIFQADVQGTREAALKAKIELEKIAGKLNVNVDTDIGAAVAKIEALRELAERPVQFGGGRGGGGGFFTSLSTSLEDAGNRIATFDNLLRGLLSLTITVFFDQLISLAIAAGGALTALASSAIQAGSALGGALVSGLAQALPAIGVFAAAFYRIKQVFDAVKQENLVQQQQSANRQKGLKQEAGAANAVANANDTLAAAHRRVGDAQQRVLEAQQKLTDARKQARRDLDDLILSEKEAELAARGAALSQKDAQEALQQAIAAGRTEDIGQAQLRVDESDLGFQRAATGLVRQRADLRTGRQQGIEGAPGVVAAKKAIDDAKQGVQDAQRAVAQAQRGLEQARRSANVAGTDAMASVGKLDFLLSQLSAPEKRLYDILTRLQKQFREVSQKVTAPLIDAFASAADRISSIMGDRRVQGALTGLSASMASSFRSISRELLSPEMVNRWMGLMKEFQRNLDPITDILRNVMRLFMDVAEAGEPALRVILGYINDVLERWTQFLDSPGGKTKFEDFLTRGAGMLTSWLDLIGAIGNLFLAIIDPGGGAASGTALVERLTSLINGLATKIRDQPEGLRKFFADVRQVFEITLTVLEHLGAALAKNFSENGVRNVQNLADVLNKILIPVFMAFLKTVSMVGDMLAWVADHRIARWIATLSITSVLIGGLASKLFIFLKPLEVVGLQFLKLATYSERAMGVLEKMARFIPGLGGLLAKLAPAAEAAAGATGAVGAAGGLSGLAGLVRGGVGGSTYGLARSFGYGRLASLGAQGGALLRSGTVLGIGGTIAGTIAGNAIGGTAGGTLKGAATGAGIGATIGSVVPILGTGVGAAAGGVIGGALGFLSGHKADEAKKKAEEIRDRLGELGTKFDDLSKHANTVKAREQFSLLSDKLSVFASTAPPEVRAQLQKIIDKANDAKKAIDKAFSREERVLDFGIKLRLDKKDLDQQKRDVRTALRSIFTTEKDPRDRAIGAAKIDQVITGMMSRKEITQKRAEELLQEANKTFKKMNDDANTKSNEALRRSAVISTAIVETTKDAFLKLGADTNKILDAFGVKPLKGITGGAVNSAVASVLAATGNIINGKGRAVGGFIGNAGERGRDAITTVVGRGEVVLNAGQQAAINALMVGQNTLASVVPRLRGWHAGGMGETFGFATGGGDLRSQAPIGGLHPGVIAAARAILDRFKSLIITSTTGGSHVKGSYHYRGEAVDIGGPVDVMHAASEWIKKSGMARRLTEGIHNPNLAVKDGQLFSGQGPFGAVWAGHKDHIHVAVAGALGKFAGAVADATTKLRRVRVDWPDNGPLKSAAQAGVDKVHAAMQKYINRKAAAATDTEVGQGRTAAGGEYDRSELERLWIKNGGRRAAAHIAAAIALAESGGNPRSQNSIGATGLWQVLISAHPEWAKGNLFDPDWNAKAAIAISNNGRNWNPWTTYTGADTPGHEKTYLRFMAGGGAVPGSGTGDTVAAMLTPGEHVWTAAEVARAGGHAAIRALRRLFGGGGQSTGGRYAAGGAVGVDSSITSYLKGRLTDEDERHENRIAALKKAHRKDEIDDENKLHKARVDAIKDQQQALQSMSSQQRRSFAIRQGIYTDPLVPARSVGAIRDEFGLDERARANRNNRGAGIKNVGRFIDNVDQITGDNGLLAQLRAAVDRTVTDMATRLRAKVNAARFSGKPLTEVDQLGLQITNYQKTISLLADESKRMEKTLGSVVGKIRTVKRQLAADDDLIERFDKRLTALRRGDEDAGQKKEISHIEDARKSAVSRRGGRQRQLQDLTAQRNDLLDAQQEAADRYQQALEDLYQAQLDQFSKSVDAGMKQRQSSVSGVSTATARRVFVALGNASQVAAADDMMLNDMKSQAAYLQGKISEASSKGYTDLADQLTQQYEDLIGSIAEATAAQMQRAIDAINAEAQRSNSRLDLRNRVADVRAGMGDAIGAARERINVSTSRQYVLYGQRDALLAQIGGRGVMDSLKNLPLDQLTEVQKSLISQIEDLDVSLQENAQNTKDLTAQLIQTAVGVTTGRSQVTQGFFGSAQSIFEKLGTLISDPSKYTDKIRAALTGALSDLKTTAAQIAGNVTSAIGEDLFPPQLKDLLGGLRDAFTSGPDAFAQYLSKNGSVISDIISTLGPEAQSAAQGLIQAMIDNTGATLDNNAALQDLDGTVEQTFQSSAWTLFRRAIFNGMGDLLPQYQVPQMETGGLVTKAGIFDLHAGEHVINPARESLVAPSGGDINIEVNQAGEDLDIDALAARISFERRTRR